MNELEFLRDAADHGGLYPAFAGMVQTVISAQEMSDVAKVQRLYELSAALNQVIDERFTQNERRERHGCNQYENKAVH